MMKLRRVLFWLHLSAGAVAGGVILLMSVTGVLLMYEKRVIQWADHRGYLSPAPVGATKLSPARLIEKARAEAGATPDSLTVYADPGAPAMLALGRDQRLYLNPYTGVALGEGSPATRKFFRFVTDWHRWLGRGGDSRPAARAVTGVCNLLFLVLVISGPFLWWPRAWNWQSFRAVLWFRRELPARARDFNWHNAIGIWCCVPLFFVVISATVISFPWASNLAYRIGGSQPPAGSARPPAPSTRPPGDSNLAGLDVAWQRAERQVPGWKSILVRLPASEPGLLVFTIDEGDPGQPQRRGILTASSSTGEIQRWEPYSGYDRGRRLRTWMRFVHTGEYYGLPGQTIAGVASAGAAVLVYSGLALALRRLFAWKKRRSRAEEPEEQALALQQGE